MMIGLHKNATIAGQCAHWRGNPFPFMQSDFQEYSEKCGVWDTDCRVASLLAMTVRGRKAIIKIVNCV